MLRTREMSLTATGTTVAGTISVPVGRYAGAHYVLTPDRGTGDITIENLGRVLLQKSNILNADGVQELAPDAEKLVTGPLAVSVAQVQAGDRVTVQVFIDQ